MADFRRALKIVLIAIITPPALCIAVFYVAFFLPADVNRYNIQQSLRLHPNATLLFEDMGGYWGSDISQKSLYYWTQEPIADVQNYYEGFLQPFLPSSDRHGNWFITSYKLDGSHPEPATTSSYLLLGSFCSDKYDRECISVALADATQVDLYRLAVSSPSTFYRLTPPPELANLPLRGTLIIYTYWVDDL